MVGEFRSFTSDIVDTSTAIEVDHIDPALPHVFAGFTFFSDAAGTTVVTPTAGTIDVDVVTLNSYPNSDNITNDDVDISEGDFTVSWDANTKSVTATLSGIVGAAYWQMRVTCNET